jgi:enoyl-CoA hydratase
MKLETVRLEIADHIATVTMDRPPVNAQNRQAREELIRVFDEISARDDVRVAILTATGKLFSAGADVKERVGIAQEPSDYIRNNRLVRDFFDAVADCAKPVICAVNGGAFGAGFALMLACDIMIASEDAYFVISELDVGLAGGGRFLMDHFGKSMTRYIYFTGRRIAAAELHRLGVLSVLVPHEKLMDEAMAIAREIAAKSPVAVREVKRALNAVEEMPARDGYRFEQTVTVALSKTEDAKEAQRAFIEKRKPEFKGK